MPELTFRLRWPDDSETVNYSPSTIVREYLVMGASYNIDDFMRRSRAALRAASARVEQIYGYPCARAQTTLASIELQAGRFAGSRDAVVTVVAISP
jgi:uncharacterized repeat protein (TIGR04042 family)